jgi:hypothetical protein
MIRSQYLRKMKDRLARLEYDIERLRARRGTPPEDVKAWIDRETDELMACADGVRKSMDAVAAAGESVWGRLKAPVDDGMRELGRRIDEAAERLRKTGSGEM